MGILLITSLFASCTHNPSISLQHLPDGKKVLFYQGKPYTGSKILIGLRLSDASIVDCPQSDVVILKGGQFGKTTASVFYQKPETKQWFLIKSEAIGKVSVDLYPKGGYAIISQCTASPGTFGTLVEQVSIDN